MTNKQLTPILCTSSSQLVDETKKINDNANETTKAGISVDIVCETCYIKGAASAAFSITGTANSTEIFADFSSSVIDEVRDVTDQFLNQTSAVISSLADDLGREFTEFLDQGTDNEIEIDIPPLAINFDIDVTPLPDVRVKFTLERDFEIYVKLNTKISGSASYELNLFSSNTLAGLSVPDTVTAGLVAVVDLIIELDAEINIRSGFHVQFDDDVAFELAMFSTDLDALKFDRPRGRFEFLPITLVSSEATLRAQLRVGLKAGLELETPSIELPLTDKELGVSSGVVVEAFLHVAEFETTVTGPGEDRDDDDDEDDCQLKVEANYQFGVGLAAGATIEIEVLEKTWGPQANSTTALFSTALVSICAAQGTEEPTPTAASVGGEGEEKRRRGSEDGPFFPRMTAAPRWVNHLFGRQEEELETITTSTTVTFIAHECLDKERAANCPASRLTTLTSKSVMTLVTEVPEGVIPTFPSTMVNSVPSQVPFGTGAQKMESKTADPSKTGDGFFDDLPEPSEVANDVKAWLDKDTNGVSNKVVLGLAVGLGVPFLIGLIFGLVYVAPFLMLMLCESLMMLTFVFRTVHAAVADATPRCPHTLLSWSGRRSRQSSTSVLLCRTRSRWCLRRRFGKDTDRYYVWPIPFLFLFN